MKLYREMLRKNRAPLLGLCAYMTVIAAVNVAAGYSLGWILDACSAEGDRVRILLRNSAACGCLFILSILMEHWGEILRFRLERALKNDLRAMIARKISALSYDRFTDGDSGAYVSWLQNDADALCSNGFAKLTDSVKSAFAAAFSFAVMTASSWYLGAAALILFALSFFLPQLLGGFMERAAQRQSAALETSLEAYKDTVMGAPIFYLSNLREQIVARIAASSDAAETEILGCRRTNRRVQTFLGIQNVTSQLALTLVAAYAVIAGAAPLGVTLSVANLCGQFFNGVRNCVQSIMAIRSTRPLWQKFETEDGGEGEKQPLGPIDEISLEDVSFAYGEHEILKNRSFRFRAGGKYALLGESGSGKTTALKLLLGLLPGYEGSILYDETEQHNANLATLYDQIAYVDQQVYLFQDTLRFNITLGRSFSDEEIMAAVRACRLEEFVASLPDGLDAVIRENGKNLSGGQRQRIALARGFIRNVRYMILDEGTSALDQENALDIEQSLMENARLGVIIITHHLNDSIRPLLTQAYRL